MKDTPDLEAPRPHSFEGCSRAAWRKIQRSWRRDIGDAWRLLDEPADHPVVSPKRAYPWIWGVCAVFAVAAIAGWLRPGSNGKEQPEMTLSIAPPAGVALTGIEAPVSAPELSPDGSAVLYVADRVTYVRRLDLAGAPACAGPIHICIVLVGGLHYRGFTRPRSRKE